MSAPLPTYIPIYPFTCPSTCLPTCLPACLHVCQPACLPVCLTWIGAARDVASLSTGRETDLPVALRFSPHSVLFSILSVLPTSLSSPPPPTLNSSPRPFSSPRLVLKADETAVCVMSQRETRRQRDRHRLERTTPNDLGLESLYRQPTTLCVRAGVCVCGEGGRRGALS